MNTVHPALVLGLDEAGLAVVRALGRAGITVYGLDTRRRIGFYSRYVSARACPDPRKDEDAFIAHLLAFAERHARKAVIFIAADRYLLAVSRHRALLEERFLILLPQARLVERLIHKYPLYQCCVEHQVPVPRSVYLASPADLGAQPSLRFPVFLKRSSADGRGASFGPGRKGSVARDPAEASHIVGAVTARGGDIIAQELVAGPDHNAYKYNACFSSEGRPLIEFTMRKLRNYPAHFGVGSCCQSVSAPEVVDLGRRFFTDLGYQGVGSIEVKRDERDGALKLIEVNARYWQQLSLATACGMDFPLAHYREATGQPPAPSQEPVVGVKWISLTMDTASYLQYRREKLMTFSDWWASLQGPKVLSDWEWPDVWPALNHVRLWRRIRLTFALLWSFIKA